MTKKMSWAFFFVVSCKNSKIDEPFLKRIL
jgi:hypothetical protein